MKFIHIIRGYIFMVMVMHTPLLWENVFSKQNCLRITHAAEKDPEFHMTCEEKIKKTRSNGLGMKFVNIEPGSFRMGSPLNGLEREDDEKPHRVTLTKGLYMQTTEVTQGQWKAVMGSNPSHFDDCGDDCPVETVSWDDAQEYIRKLNKREGGGTYRLPTEAEWEYACRAGTKTPFWFGKCLSTEQANYDGDYPMPGCSNGRDRGKTMPVAGFPANGWGLYNMHGNVYEWCRDWFGVYPSGSVVDPVGPSSGSDRVVRGGSWLILAGSCRSANRNWSRPGYRGKYVGFRLVLSSF